MNLPGVLVSILGALVLLVGALALVYEAWALGHGWTPITGYVHGLVARWPRTAALVALILGVLLGHLLWPG